MVRIPEEYQEVEYIESTGTQYIYTDIPAKSGIECSAMVVWLGGRDTSIFGGRKDSSDRIMPIHQYPANKWTIGYGSAHTDLSNIIYGNLYKVEAKVILGEQYLKINDSIIYENTEALEYTNDFNMSIFACTYNTKNNARLFSIARIYNLSVKIDNELIAEFVPCYRKSDNEIGMYDIVSKTFYTNSGTGTFLKGHNVYYDDVNLLEQRRKILLNTPHLETVSNNIATFNTDMNVSLKDCKIYFSPIQEGEGDPSPDNVRPISGWDGIDVYIGRNILDGMTLNYRNGNIIYPYGYGSVTVYSKIGSACTNWIDCSQYRGQTLTLNHAPEPGSAGWCFYSATNTSDYVTGFYSRDDSSVVEGGLWTITVPDGDNINYMRFSTHPDYLDDVQILLNMETTTISFPQTIYGGYVDLIKGEIVDQWKNFIINGTEASYSQSSNQRFAITVDPINKNLFYERTNAKHILCDKLASLGANGMGALNYKVAVLSTQALQIKINADINTPQLLKEWLINNPLNIIIEMQKPDTYTLTSQTLKALKGTNNIFSNANGNIEVKFWKHLNNTYQHIPAETLTTTDDFIITTNDNYIIGNENNYIIY